MELLTAMVIMLFTSIPVAINPTWMMKAILCFVPIVIGALILIEGITHNGTTLITAGPNPKSLLLFIVMTFGSLLTAYSTSIGKDTK